MKKAGVQTCLSRRLEAGYFFISSAFLGAFLAGAFLPSAFFPSAFFVPSPFFWVFFASSFICAPAFDAAKAEALTAANIAATITDSSLFISFSWLVFEHGFAAPRAAS